MEDESISSETAPEASATGEKPFELPPLGILAGLSERSLVDLAAYGRCHRLPAKSELMREGEMQDRFYIVVSGEVGITTEIGGKEVSLSTAKSGDCIGELNLLDPGPASATVKVRKDSTLWSMDAEQLRTYLFEHTGGAGALLMGIAHTLSNRIRTANQLIIQNHKTPIETLPPGRERAITATNTPVQLGFFDRLRKSLSSSKKVRISTKIKM